MVQRINIVLIILVVSLSIIALYYAFQSNSFIIRPGNENNRSGSNGSIVNNSTQNTTKFTKNTISIPLEKPPFIKD